MSEDAYHADTDDYDFVVNAIGELMLVIYAPDDPIDSGLTAFIFNSEESEATLVRNKNSLMIFDLTDELAELLTGGLATVLVNEIDSEGNSVNVDVERSFINSSNLLDKPIFS